MTEKGIVYIGFGKFARWHWLVKPSDIQITAIVDPGLHESVYLIQGQNPGEEVFYTLSELREAGLPGIDMQDLPGIDSPGVFLSSAQEINKFSEIPLKKSLVELIDSGMKKNEVLYFSDCSPPEHHLNNLMQIFDFDDSANILVEKPVCLGNQQKELSDLCLAHPEAKVAVNEHMNSSALSQRIKELIEEHDLKPTEIYTESTKNRVNDFDNGRYQTESILWNDGPHTIAILQDILGTQLTGPFVEEVEDLQTEAGPKRNHGSIDMRFEPYNGCRISQRISQNGQIGYLIPEFVDGWDLDVKNKIQKGKEYRYRIVRIYDENKDIEILGQYEPVGERLSGIKRGAARLIVKNLGETIISEDLYDDSLRKHLSVCRDYFMGKAENPATIEQALGIVGLIYHTENLLPK